MKKQLRKPENWQDFESLCKKLWGEIWQVPAKIKKNGRLGQPQSGVDVYAIPKGAQGYWGIQCKGKDEYVHAKITETEIDQEIEKARTFIPTLEVYIIATTANKDVAIEEYVRLKDLENKQSGGFEILIYCWEDIADLIEENRETFNYYVNKHQFRDHYGFKVYLNNMQSEIVLLPEFTRKIRRWRAKDRPRDYAELIAMSRIKPYKDIYSILRDVSNKALCKFEIIMVNEGSQVIEDWRVIFEFPKDRFTKISDDAGIDRISRIANPSMIRTVCEDNFVTYYPLNRAPLVQKDNRSFIAWIEPLPEEYDITVNWKIISRDYNDQGTLKIFVHPKFEDEFIYIDVESKAEEKADEILEVKAKSD